MKRYVVTAFAVLVCPANAQLPVILQEPTFPIARERVDTIRCPNGHKLELSIAQHLGASKDGPSRYRVGIKVEGRAVDASVIDPMLLGYNVLASDVTLAGCPDAFTDTYSGEIVYWLDYGNDATWEDRVFIRFSVDPDGVRAERITNVPPRDYPDRGGSQP